MPSTTLTVDRSQRQPLHRQLTQRISGIGDVYLAIVREDFAAAERLGREFAEDLRLLGALGWDPADRCGVYELALPRDELLRSLRRLCLEAEGGLKEPEEIRTARAQDEEALVHYARVREVCVEMIGDLDAPAGTAL